MVLAPNTYIYVSPAVPGLGIWEALTLTVHATGAIDGYISSVNAGTVTAHTVRAPSLPLVGTLHGTHLSFSVTDDGDRHWRFSGVVTPHGLFGQTIEP